MNSFSSLTPLSLEEVNNTGLGGGFLYSALHYGTALENNIRYAVYYYQIQ